jgi:hypothetical protein
VEQAALTILIGTTAGLLTAMLVGGVKQYIVKVVLPWYENLIYKDVKIEGRWHAEAVINNRDVERVWVITRQGHDVTATITSTAGFDKGQTFQMKGTFKNLV